MVEFGYIERGLVVHASACVHRRYKERGNEGGVRVAQSQRHQKGKNAS